MMPKKVRPIRIEDGIAYVALTKGYTAIIDAEDVPLVDSYNWHAQVDSSAVYAVSNYRQAGVNRRKIFLHRLIADPKPGEEVDHADHDGLNNRRANLRNCTRPQNLWNRPRQRNNTSGYKGVCWHKGARKWVAKVRVEGTMKNLGVFDDPEDAHVAYCEAVKSLHKDFFCVGGRRHE
jgi:hypothetical protein